MSESVLQAPPPDGVRFVELGEVQLKGFARPVRLLEVCRVSRIRSDACVCLGETLRRMQPAEEGQPRRSLIGRVGSRLVYRLAGRERA